jgi:glyoxylase-like metal-dependent hydrolase (beta-lactamase superfamily II)
VLYLGDAVCGGRLDVGVPDGEVGQHTLLGRSPEAIRELIPDKPKSRRALARLLAQPFDVLAFGHGAPIRDGAPAALRRFLKRANVWST